MPAPLRLALTGHDVSTAHELGWSTLKNGELLEAAVAAGFSLLLTTDTNLKYQQNLASRRIVIVVLRTTSWPRIKVANDEVVRAVQSSAPGSYAEVRIP